LLISFCKKDDIGGDIRRDSALPPEMFERIRQDDGKKEKQDVEHNLILATRE
jgi:hypothetical protein